MWQKSFPYATENAGDHPILWHNHLIMLYDGMIPRFSFLLTVDIVK